MGELVNLKRMRKARAKTERQAEAAANRSLRGRTKAEKQHTAAGRAAAARMLEGHRIADAEPVDPQDNPETPPPPAGDERA